MIDQVKKYIDNQEPVQRDICLKLRKIILKTLPQITEDMKWGAIVYGGGKYYVAVVKYGVNLGFAVNGLDKNEIKQFEGSGKTMRHIKINSLSDIDESKLIKLIKMVNEKTVCQ